MKMRGLSVVGVSTYGLSPLKTVMLVKPLPSISTRGMGMSQGVFV
jgi:hypothetical protein